MSTVSRARVWFSCNIECTPFARKQKQQLLDTSPLQNAAHFKCRGSKPLLEPRLTLCSIVLAEATAWGPRVEGDLCATCKQVPKVSTHHALSAGYNSSTSAILRSPAIPGRNRRAPSRFPIQRGPWWSTCANGSLAMFHST